jgi:hypothetical protein
MDFRIILDYCVCEEVDVNKDVSVYYDLLHTKSVPILPCPFQPLLNIHNNMGNDGSVLNLKKYNWRGGKSQHGRPWSNGVSVISKTQQPTRGWLRCK